jgi:CRISPR-associated protein Csa3
MAKVLISTLYGPDPLILASTRLSPDKLILLITDENDKTIKESLKLINKSLGRVLSISTHKIPQYDIIKISRTVVRIIDKISLDDEILINITSGRKTQSIGVLFGAFARQQRIKRITYYPEGAEKGNVVYLPILSTKLPESQEKILDSIKVKKGLSYKDLESITGLSTAMVYRAVDDLIQKGLLEKTEQGLVLTDAGLLMRL